MDFENKNVILGVCFVFAIWTICIIYQNHNKTQVQIEQIKLQQMMYQNN